MLCVVIRGPSIKDAHQQIAEAQEYADIVELRLDLFSERGLSSLQKLRNSFSLPMLFTLRKQSQGGNYSLSEEERLAEILLFATLKPEYIDLENDVPAKFIQVISTAHPSIKLIRSYHNFHETPANLEAIFQEMAKVPTSIYKISVTPASALDALRFLCWAKTVELPLISISMGSHGQISRILGPIVGSPITYASLSENENTAPGQLSAKILAKRYHYHSLTSQTAIYGLIGNPVDKSISDITHNFCFEALGLDAIYVKILIHESEMGEFLVLAKRLGIMGLSVTMPLKETIIPYIDDINPESAKIGAVNTLRFENGKITGFNTDGMGALNAIESVLLVKNKKVIVIGAGGAAKAIVHEALRRGALVTVVNRDANKAEALADNYGCSSKGLDQFTECVESGYDILINCTPLAMPLKAEDILPNTLVMDINTKPKETEFLQCALKKGCQVVYGYQMFVEQAMGQYALWFENPHLNVRQILSQKALECL